MRIEKLHLENIGVFDSFDLEFQPCQQSDKAEIHIFAGENGTGKSTLLYALAGAFTSDNNLILKRFRTEKNAYVELLTEKGQYKYFDDSKSAVPLEYEDNCQNYQKNIFNFAVFAYSGNRSLKSHHLVGIK
jgi:predicted ATPase